MFFFFFSSRRRHTRFDCDWSSDVCSSDAVANFYQATLETLSYEAVLLSYDGQPLASTNAGGGGQTASAPKTPIFQKRLPGSEFGSYICARLLEIRKAHV